MSSPEPIEHSPFKDMERAGWETVAAQYHDLWSNLTKQSIEPLLDVVSAEEGRRVLDVATGPGYAAAVAARRGAEVIGIDFSSAQVALAKESYPDVDFLQGDAEDLPFPDEAFDALVMNYGMLHLAHPDRAVSEAHRVLKSGGGFGFTVWANPNEPVGLSLVRTAIEAHGNPDVPLPPGPPFFRFSDADESRRVLIRAGFEAPEVAQLPQIWKVPSVDTLLTAMLEATVRTRALLLMQTPETVQAIRMAMAEAARPFMREGGLEIPSPAVLASAVKP